MAEKFTADPDAIASVGKTYNSEAETLSKAIAKYKTPKTSGATTGNYASQGATFATDYQHVLSTLLNPMHDEIVTGGGNLLETAHDYRHRDDSNSANVTKSGKGA